MKVRVILRFFSCLVFTSCAIAQTATGVMRGTVQDLTGAILGDVHVMLINQATNQSWEQTTNEEGLFEFRTLLIGKYRVDAEHPRFRKEVFQNIAL